jgi:2-amino-4-hydroxy-6-hydroxymethyldihydropteridine diphosphokinase
VRVDTEHDTYDILTAIQDIEAAMGKVQREKPKKHEEIVYTDRVIDIDVLLYDDMISHTSDITIPHRSIAQRDFFLQPLIHLDSELRCPMTDALYAEMLAAIPEEDRTILDVIHDWHG